MKNKKFLPKDALIGSVIGIVNGFFGAGGGLVCVPLLNNSGMERKQSHANAVAVIFPITLISAVGYLLQGKVTVGEALIYIPTGLIGAAVGTFILKKISPNLIKKVFGIFMVWAGWRLITK